jgi:hypothetical protein
MMSMTTMVTMTAMMSVVAVMSMVVAVVMRVMIVARRCVVDRLAVIHRCRAHVIDRGRRININAPGKVAIAKRHAAADIGLGAGDVGTE